jgi:hypothetical protein
MKSICDNCESQKAARLRLGVRPCRDERIHLSILESCRELCVTLSCTAAPIPTRAYDFQAVDDRTLDYDSPVGFGSNPQEAIDSLLDAWEFQGRS